MASDAFRVLVTIADSFLEQGKPLEAIKCLQAVCQSEKAEFPQLEAEARLRLAGLLLDHTHNVKEAARNLESANLVLGKAEGSWDLKCAIHARLAACHRHPSARRQLLAACEAGLALCARGASSPEAGRLAQWRLHFLTLQARVHAADGDTEAALACLTQASPPAGQEGRPDTEALLLLAAMQARLQAGDTSILQEGSAALEAALCAADSMHLTLQWHVVRSAFLLYRGNVKEHTLTKEGAKAGEPPRQLETLDRLSREAAAAQGGGHHCLAALAQLLCAAARRPTDKWEKAQPHLAAAAAFLDAAEAGLPLSLQEGEARIPSQHRPAARQVLWLRSLLLEHRAGIDTTRKALAEAAQHIAALGSLLQRFPELLAGQRATLHLLAGGYCQETREPQAAVRHCEAALACAADPATRGMAAAQTALALLASGEQGAATRALDALRQAGVWGGVSEQMLAPESAAAHLAAASVLLAREDSDGARQRAMKALKLAHDPLQNQQLVGKLMLVLAPTYVAEDPAAVRAMAANTLQLAKNVSDLSLEVEAGKLACGWMEREGKAAKLAEQRARLQRKQADLEQAVGKARAAGELHAAVLAWGLEQPEAEPEPKPEAAGKRRRR